MVLQVKERVAHEMRKVLAQIAKDLQKREGMAGFDSDDFMDTYLD